MFIFRKIQKPKMNRSPDNGKKLRVLDVRQPQEYAINRIPNSALIPLGNPEYNLHALDRNEEIIVL